MPTLPDTDVPDPRAPIVVYGGFGVSCPVCGRPTQEFAHLRSGRVYARHRTVLLGVENWFDLCVIQ